MKEAEMICQRTLQLIILLIVILFCCSATLATLPPTPEVVIPNVTKKEVANKLIDNASTKGWILKNSTEFLIVVEYPMKGLGASILYGSKWKRTPNARIQYQLTGIPEGVRVVAKMFIVTNPGTGLESIRDETKGKHAQDLQAELERIRAELSTGKR
jgi:hypothetical protein